VKIFDWDEKKNQELKAERDICFEDILIAIVEDRLLDIVKHPNPKRYGNQKIFILDVNNYAYLVPFVEIEDEISLKTIIPCRKATKKYLIDKDKEEKWNILI